MAGNNCSQTCSGLFINRGPHNVSANILYRHICYWRQLSSYSSASLKYGCTAFILQEVY
mgnify:CR=1 FL=1